MVVSLGHIFVGNKILDVQLSLRVLLMCNEVLFTLGAASMVKQM